MFGKKKLPGEEEKKEIKEELVQFFTKEKELFPAKMIREENYSYLLNIKKAYLKKKWGVAFDEITEMARNVFSLDAMNYVVKDEVTVRQYFGYILYHRRGVPVDILGSDLCKWVLRLNKGRIDWKHFVASKDLFSIYESDQKIESFEKSDASWILIDFFGLICGLYDNWLKDADRMRGFMDWLISYVKNLYKKNIILLLLEVKDQYIDAEGQIVSFERLKTYHMRNKELQRWQRYFVKKTGCHVLDFAKDFQADATHFAGLSPVNYELEFYEKAYHGLEKTVNQFSGRHRCADILIDAHCNQNLGDDLFVQALIERYPNRQFSLLVRTKRVATAFEKYENVKLILETENPIFDFINQYIFIGGSMFMEVPFWNVKYYSLRQRLLVSQKKFMLGINFGPYYSKDYLLYYRELFRRFDDICVRDQSSYELLKELPSVRCEKDIVFAMEQETRREDEDYIAIAPIFFGDSQKQEAYATKLLEITKNLVARGHKVKLLAFYIKLRDDETCQWIRDELEENEQKQVEVYRYTGNTHEMMEYVAGANYVIATRFHSVVLALKNQVACFPIAYSKKTENMLKDLGYDQTWISMEQFCEEAPNMNVVMGNQPFDLPKEVKESAKRQFAALDREFKYEKH